MSQDANRLPNAEEPVDPPPKQQRRGPEAEAPKPAAPCLSPAMRAEQASLRQLDMEIEAARLLAPATKKALDLGLEAYADLCNRLESGEDVDQEAFHRTLGILSDVVFNATEFRWQSTRNCVRGLLDLIEGNDWQGDGDIRKIQERLLMGRHDLKRRIQRESPDGTSRSRQRLRQTSLKMIEGYMASKGYIQA